MDKDMERMIMASSGILHPESDFEDYEPTKKHNTTWQHMKIKLPKEPEWYGDWGGESGKTARDLFKSQLKELNPGVEWEEMPG